MISNQVSGTGQQMTGPGPVVPAPSPDFLFNAQTAVGAAVRTPAIATLSAARDIRKWTVKASVQMNFWNTFNHLSINMPNAFATNSTIQTKWSNSWFAALGADYKLNSAWTLRAGTAYDQTPTNNTTRDPRIPDSDRYWLTAGASYNLTKYLSIDGAYEHIFSPNQTVNVTEATGSNAIATLPLEVNHVNAKYQSSVDIVALALRFSF
jgi:long-chain fatty acid transport protein